MTKDSNDKQLNSNGDRRGMSPNSRKNLEKRSLKGNNNAKSLTITTTIRGMLDEPCPERWLHAEDKNKGLTWRQAIAGTILAGAVAGKPGIISELLDRLEGKVSQPISGDKENPIQVEIDAKGKLISAINRLAARAGETEDTKKP